MSHRLWFGAGLFLFVLLLGGVYWLKQGGGTTQPDNPRPAGSVALGDQRLIDAGAISADGQKRESPPNLVASRGIGGSDGAVSAPASGVESIVPPTDDAETATADGAGNSLRADGRDASDVGRRSQPQARDRGGVKDNGSSGDEGAGSDTLAGQVLFTDGVPASGVTVGAMALRLFPDQETGTVSMGSSEGRTVTDVAGRFLISGLANGEYQLRAIGPFSNPVEASQTVRAGSQDVRIVLGRDIRIWVDGYVASREEGPLHEVAVSTSDGQGIAALSTADGLFGLSLQVRSDRPAFLTLVKEGYEDARVSVDAAARDEQGVVPIDVTMVPVLGSITVAGTVRDAAGNGLAGVSVYLQGGGSKYRAVSDATGAYAIQEVRRPGAYILWVSPGDGYGGYREPRLKVPMAGVSGHEIVLERVGSGRVYGQMLDAQGRAVPNFTLSVESADAPGEAVAVTGDGQGYFIAEDVPEGRLRVQSSSFPRFVTSGVTLSAGGEIEVKPRLDIGNEQLAGRVIGDAGAPVAGADVTLSWVLRDGTVTHESLRKTVSNSRGEFVFVGLGKLSRNLSIRAAKFEPVRLEGVGTSKFSDVEVQLMPMTK
jgi:hypothetical protein